MQHSPLRDSRSRSVPRATLRATFVLRCPRTSCAPMFTNVRSNDARAAGVRKLAKFAPQRARASQRTRMRPAATLRQAQDRCGPAIRSWRRFRRCPNGPRRALGNRRRRAGPTIARHCGARLSPRQAARRNYSGESVALIAPTREQSSYRIRSGCRKAESYRARILPLNSVHLVNCHRNRNRHRNRCHRNRPYHRTTQTSNAPIAATSDTTKYPPVITQNLSGSSSLLGWCFGQLTNADPEIMPRSPPPNAIAETNAKKNISNIRSLTHNCSWCFWIWIIWTPRQVIEAICYPIEVVGHSACNLITNII